MRFSTNLEKQNELAALFVGHWLVDFANFSAFVFNEFPDLNWAGFYLYSGNQLLLGPFQGRPACTSIALGRGVCGAAFTTQKALRVANVQTFPGHIACDPQSKSEMVLPLIKDHTCFGVFDLDSPLENRFQAQDQADLERALEILLKPISTLQVLEFPWR